MFPVDYPSIRSPNFFFPQRNMDDIEMKGEMIENKRVFWIKNFGTRLDALEARCAELKRLNVKPETFKVYHEQKVDINELVRNVVTNLLAGKGDDGTKDGTKVVERGKET